MRTAVHPVSRAATRRLLVSGLVVLLLGVLAAPAFAHVTVRTDDAAAGGFAVYTVRVPNESDVASTVLVELQIPEGLEASRYQPKPGWTLQIEDGIFTIEGGEIAPGQFEEFRFQARNPEEAGPLTMPAIQTYDDGEIAEWTGEPDADMPAPVVEITAASGDGHGGGHGATEAGATEAGATEVAGSDDAGSDDAGSDDGGSDGVEAEGAADPALASTTDQGSSNTVGLLALALAVLALVAGGLAFVRSGRS